MQVLFWKYICPRRWRNDNLLKRKNVNLFFLSNVDSLDRKDLSASEIINKVCNHKALGNCSNFGADYKRNFPYGCHWTTNCRLKKAQPT